MSKKVIYCLSALKNSFFRGKLFCKKFYHIHHKNIKEYKMEKFRLAIIGTGVMGSGHVRFISELENCSITALCDTDPAKLERHRKLENCAFFTSDDEFFANSHLYDGVLIATPHYDHVPLAIRAVELGKHIIVEKPVAVQKSEAQRLIDTLKKHPEVKAAAMFCLRQIEAHKKIKHLIDSGELGELRRVNWIITNWFRTQFYYNSGAWRASWRGEGGGALLNQCPHQLDLMQWFFGMPSKITAHMSFGKYHDIEVEDDVTAFLEYPNGATGVFITSTGEFPGTNRLEITGERGKVVYEDGKILFTRNETGMTEHSLTTSEKFAGPAIWNVEIPAASANSHMHRDIIENLVNAVQKGDKLIAGAEEGINGLELSNAMLLSQLEGRTIELPIDAALFDKHLQKLIDSSRYQKTVAEDVEKGDLGSSFSK